jgi:hypothetical protein
MVVGREWVLDAVEDWLLRSDERFLLLVAEPGWGKTAIAEWLAGEGPASARVEALRTRIDATHFCVARGQDGKANPGRFATSIAEQLTTDDGVALALLAEETPRTYITQNVEQNLGRVAAVQNLIVNQVDPADIYHRTIRRPLQRLAEGNPGIVRTILVDALDEAPAIVGLLAGSGDFPPGIRFLLTSRDVPAVVNAFDDVRLIDLSATKFAGRTGADLAEYISGAIEDGGRAAAVLRQADGNFLYAHWVLEELAQGTITDVGALPPGLNGLYRHFLDRLVPDREAWTTWHRPFFGCLTVAVPVAPDDRLPQWLKWSRDDFNLHLDDVNQVIEYVPDPPEGDEGYRLYHRSIADFLAVKAYEERGRRQINRYYVEPLKQHERIVAYYLARADWAQADDYCLRRLVHHLAARARIAGDDDTAADLYRVILDERFRLAQQDKLMGIHQSLADLRGALDVALGRADLFPALRCVAAYRGITTAESLSAAVFEAVADGDVARARQEMTHYTAGPNASAAGSEVLKLYLAWEAAESGDETDARELIAETRNAPYELGNALVVRVARALGADPATLGVPQWSAEQYGVAAELSPGELSEVVARLDPKIDQLEVHTESKSGAAASSHSFVPEPDAELMDPETSSGLAYSMGADLGLVAANGVGRRLIERTLAALYRNPYPRYRDLALQNVGIAVMRSPDRLWVRTHFQHLLRASLDDEGITFTFDLPALLVAEGDRRGMDFEDLRAYLARAAAEDDVWGTRMRASAARAAAAFRTGEPDKAIELLLDASRASATYAGYGALGILSLIGRCHEFGRPELARERIWGWGGGRTLPAMAQKFAVAVYDPDFRRERSALVEDHSRWCAEPSPDLAAALAQHSRLIALDTRAAYRDLVAARWSAAGPASARHVANLVPHALADSTGLDTLLARFVAVGLDRRTDEEVRTLAELAAESFTTGRPWLFGKWR